jgi:ABC-type maltose transport system permease subunit
LISDREAVIAVDVRIVFLFLQHYCIQGVMAGSVKE